MENQKFKTIWQDKYTIHSFDVDHTKRARLSTLLGFMQETAWKHADHLGVGFRHLADSNLLWFYPNLKLKLIIILSGQMRLLWKPGQRVLTDCSL